MSVIVTRAGKGSPLTNNEMDQNLINLNNDKVETSVLAAYAPLADPIFTGNPTAPNPTYGDNDTSIATTSYVQSNAVAKSTQTGSAKLPAGTTSERDGTPSPGWMRFNTQTNGWEGANNSLVWTSIGGGQLAGLRNKLINGDFRVWQRGNSIACPANTSTYTADRWKASFGGSNGTVDYGGGTRVIGLFPTAGNTGIALFQWIESDNSYDLAGKNITISGKVSTPAGITQIYINFWKMTTKDNMTGLSLVQQQLVTGLTPNTTTPFSKTFTLPADADKGLVIEWGCTNAPSGSMVFSAMQLEEGSIATPFEQRPIGLELSLCQRYYEQGTASVAISNTGIVFGNIKWISSIINYKQNKRTNATVTLGTLDLATDCVPAAAGTNIQHLVANQGATEFEYAIGGGGTPPTSGNFAYAKCVWAASAEL